MNTTFTIQCLNPAANNPGERLGRVILVFMEGLLFFWIKL
jgi:hypothetical protein